MGVYEICFGKGIILPMKVFVKFFMKEIKEWDLTDFDEVQYKIQDLLTVRMGERYEITKLGHDAFDGRHGPIFDMFDETENKESAEKISELLDACKNSEEYKDDFFEPYDNDLVFIGFYRTLAPPGQDLSYYIKAPEVIYSLASFLPKIIKEYPILQSMDCEKLSIFFEQQACIWTFTSDCTCCG